MLSFIIRNAEDIKSKFTCHLPLNFSGRFIFQAGLSSSRDSSQVFIALEPEAAAVYCRQRKLREFVEKNGEEILKDTLVPVKTRYLVIDNGGKNPAKYIQTLIYNNNNNQLCLTRVAHNSLATDKPVALEFSIELEFGSVGFCGGRKTG